MSDTKLRALDREKILAMVRPGGAISQCIEGFTLREAQVEMLSEVIEAYNRSSIALIEAGTGTGKSLAYLLPAICWAAANKERSVISTATINLQEQLLQKDIPLILKALNLDMQAVLVKGMGNYLCLKRMQEATHELKFAFMQDQRELNQIEDWSERTSEGSRSDLPFMPSTHVWQQVRAESDSCDNQRCPHYQKCFFFKARRKAEEARILVVNHHLLFADLAFAKDKGGVLPKYERLILDEAHHIEAIATEYFGERISRFDLLQQLARLGAEKSAGAATTAEQTESGLGRGRLALLVEKLDKQYGVNPDDLVTSIRTRLKVDLPAKRNELVLAIGHFFDVLSDYLDHNHIRGNSAEGSGRPESKLRLLERHYVHPQWLEGVQSQARNLLEHLRSYVASVMAVLEDLGNLKNDKFVEETQGLRGEATAALQRLTEAQNLLRKLIFGEHNPEEVRWIESSLFRAFQNVQMVSTALDVAKPLAERLFNQFPTVILCSATLTTNQQFDFVKERLGLTEMFIPEKKMVERCYPSPFDYQKQTLLVIPNDMPPPSDPSFLQCAAEKVLEAVQASRGNAFVLFTSYTMLAQMYGMLEEPLQKKGYHLMKQGDASRAKLLERFRSQDRSILFGTDSFWEGVDVAGEALRCVIIVKLPFQVPTEPVVEARMEAINRRGGNSFLHYAVPSAIVKFKQGFGRLIRHRKDRGCMVCLDSRLLNKAYGKLFLNSLPDCTLVTDGKAVASEMEAFYRKTYPLTLSK